MKRDGDAFGNDEGQQTTKQIVKLRELIEQ